jgi:hypothetical protein
MYPEVKNDRVKEFLNWFSLIEVNDIGKSLISQCNKWNTRS